MTPTFNCPQDWRWPAKDDWLRAFYVYYLTTEYCKTFSTILLEMIKWGIAHKKHISRKK